MMLDRFGDDATDLDALPDDLWAARERRALSQDRPNDRPASTESHETAASDHGTREAAETLTEPKTGEVFERATRYEVTAWPGAIDSPNRHPYVLYVEWRGDDRWCVTDGIYCYRRDGHKKYERNPSSRTDRFKKAYRFSLEEALQIARKQAPKIRVGAGPARPGMTAAEMWAWEQTR